RGRIVPEGKPCEGPRSDDYPNKPIKTAIAPAIFAEANRTACEANAKASPNVNVLPVLRADPKFELRTRVFVTKLLYDKQAKRLTGVLYTDMKTGDEYEQPAGLVVLSSYVFGNTQQLLLAGIGEPYDRSEERRVGRERRVRW